MELREWQYINKPAAGSASAASSGNKSFKKRFDKLIQYYGQHLPAEVDYVTVNLLTPGSLNFTEHLDNGDKVNYDIFLDDFDTVEWRIKYRVNNQLIDDYSGTGWEELLYTLDAGYIDLPKKGTPEYKNLLTEWVVMNNKTSFSGYKKRFEKLIKYHIDHASSELESITKKDIKEDGFRLSEHYNNGHHEFDRDIVVSYDKDSDTFMLRIFVDGKEVDNILRKGYEAFVTAAEGYMFLPDEGTEEYDDLLTESLKEWHLMNPPQPATSKNPYTRGQAYRYNRLLDQITSDGIAKYKLHKITNNTLDITVDTKKTKDLNIKIVYNLVDNDYELITNGRTSLSGCDYEKDILPLLVAGGIINNTDLCESASSIADDFKLYENLWN